MEKNARCDGRMLRRLLCGRLETFVAAWLGMLLAGATVNAGAVTELQSFAAVRFVNIRNVDGRAIFEAVDWSAPNGPFGHWTASVSEGDILSGSIVLESFSGFSGNNPLPGFGQHALPVNVNASIIADDKLRINAPHSPAPGSRRPGGGFTSAPVLFRTHEVLIEPSESGAGTPGVGRNEWTVFSGPSFTLPTLLPTNDEKLVDVPASGMALKHFLSGQIRVSPSHIDKDRLEGSSNIAVSGRLSFGPDPDLASNPDFRDMTVKLHSQLTRADILILQR